MSTERRYTEKEIATIFENASSAQRAAHDHPSAGEGLTLDELQEIGTEVGISPEFVQRAASDLDSHVPAPPLETFFGIPASASHAVDIPGPFTDEDWDRLVVDLRQTFQARGEITIDGSIREWRNGNLFASVEPSARGVRLRLGSRKVETRYSIAAGIGWFVFLLLVALLKFSQNDFAIDYKTLFTIVLAFGGLGLSGYSAAWLRDWAGKRKTQMEGIAARALKAKGAAGRTGYEPDDTQQAEIEPRLLEIPDEPAPSEADHSDGRKVRE